MQCARLLCFLMSIVPALSIGAETPVLQLERSIPLPGVEGRIDHIALDAAGERLFVAALGNGSVEVLDLKNGKRLKTLAGLNEPQGVAWEPDSGKLFVACGGDGSLHIFDGKNLAEQAALKLGGDADNLRYSSATKRIYAGYGSGAIAIIDPAKGIKSGEIKVAGHPEAFALDASARRIFVNVPPRSVEVLDLAGMKRVSAWKLDKAAENFPMALDERSRRLFVGCRSPARIEVLDTTSGQCAASLAAPGDVDDIFFDPAAKRLYASGGEGLIFVYTQSSPDRYTLAEKVSTAPGARTSLLSPDGTRLYLAVPQRGEQQAEIRVYKAAAPSQ